MERANKDRTLRVRTEVDLAEKVEAAAEAQGVTPSDVMRQALERHVETFAYGAKSPLEHLSYVEPAVSGPYADFVLAQLDHRAGIPGADFRIVAAFDAMIRAALDRGILTWGPKHTLSHWLAGECLATAIRMASRGFVGFREIEEQLRADFANVPDIAATVDAAEAKRLAALSASH